MQTETNNIPRDFTSDEKISISTVPFEKVTPKKKSILFLEGNRISIPIEAALLFFILHSASNIPFGVIKFIFITFVSVHVFLVMNDLIKRGVSSYYSTEESGKSNAYAYFFVMITIFLMFINASVGVTH